MLGQWEVASGLDVARGPPSDKPEQKVQLTGQQYSEHDGNKKTV